MLDLASCHNYGGLILQGFEEGIQAFTFSESDGILGSTESFFPVSYGPDQVFWSPGTSKPSTVVECTLCCAAVESYSFSLAGDIPPVLQRAKGVIRFDSSIVDFTISAFQQDNLTDIFLTANLVTGQSLLPLYSVTSSGSLIQPSQVWLPACALWAASTSTVSVLHRRQPSRQQQSHLK